LSPKGKGETGNNISEKWGGHGGGGGEGVLVIKHVKVTFSNSVGWPGKKKRPKRGETDPKARGKK